MLACAHRDGLRIWNLLKNKEVAFARIAGVYSVLFHERTASLVAAGQAGVYQWPISVVDDASRWQIGPPRKLLDATATPDEATLVQSRDGSRLAAVIDHPRKVVVFDLASSTSPIELEGNANVRGLALSPDGQWVAGTLFGVKIWNAQTGRLIQDLWPECDRGLSFSPDGKRLAAGSATEIRIYETETWKLVHQLHLQDHANRGIAWSPDGRLLCVNIAETPKLLDPRTGAEVATVLSQNDAGNIESLCFSPHGGRLAVVYRHAIEAWDLHQVRRGLAEMDLDWDSPELPVEAVHKTPERVEFDLGDLAPKTLHADYIANARLNTLNGEWKAAAENYEKALAGGTTDPEFLFEIAAGLLIAGKDQKYRELCGVLLKRHGKTKSSRTAYVVARTVTLGTEGPLDPEGKRLAALAVESDKRSPWYFHTLGLACYREGHLEEAVTWLEKASKLKWDADVANSLALAIVYQRLDNVEKADMYWRRATEWLKKPVALHPHDRVAVKLLRDEAERVRAKQ
jgi:tetratricopeptide (TPR) repeat protein